MKDIFQKIREKLLCSDLIQCHYDYECPAMYLSVCKKLKNKSVLAILFQSSKWKFALLVRIKFFNLFLYSSK